MKSRILDQFYTKTTVADDCLSKILNFLQKENYRNLFFVEPSAGTGSFFNLFPKNKRLGFDLEPKTDGVILQDFLEVDINKFGIMNKNKIVVGNPPFGKNSSLAIKFFNKASEFASVIGLIVPKTFKKDSVKNKLNSSFWLVEEYDLGLDSFIFNNKDYSVPCVFQIWEKRTEHRSKEKFSMVVEDFSFVSKDDADFAIQRVGAAAGKVKVEFKKYAPTSHYFIKGGNEVRKIFEDINWDSVKFNTAGNPSISKKELIKEFSNRKNSFISI